MRRSANWATKTFSLQVIKLAECRSKFSSSGKNENVIHQKQSRVDHWCNSYDIVTSFENTAATKPTTTKYNLFYAKKIVNKSFKSCFEAVWEFPK